MGGSQSVNAKDEVKSVGSIMWDDPIIRRGGIYNFSFKEDTIQGIDEYSQKISLRVEANGDIMDEAKISYSLEDTSETKWKVKVIRKSGEDPVCQLESPVNCDIGGYEITLKMGDNVLMREKFLMFCNPWNINDETYMPNDVERDEYILNPETVIYYGHPDYIKSKNWCLNQFSKPAIETLLVILRKMDKSSRSCMYKFARELTVMISNLEKDGILEFTKERESYDGINPEDWTGSKGIFEKFLAEKEIVKYGHGISIAGVLCSICRLAGIGSRIVTGYSIANDNDGTIDLEVYHDENYKLIRELSKDTVFTFHSWVECNIRYPCLDKYDGWQVCDATPKKTSENPHLTCGPVPVIAVKTGDLNVGFETKYVYSEVNANVIQMVMVDGKPQKFLEQDSIIGKKIVTKAIGSNDVSDITDNYKHKQGSVLDKVSRINADTTQDDESDQKISLTFENVSHKQSILLGQGLELKVDLQYGKGDKIDLTLKCYVIHHPNILSDEIVTKTLKFGRKKLKSDLFKVDARTILGHIKSDACIVLVEGFFTYQGQFYKKEVRYPIETPPITITVPNKIFLDRSCPIVVKMDNTLPYNMENVNVLLELDFCDENENKLIGKVSKYDILNAKFTVIPKLAGMYGIRVIIRGPNIPTLHEVKTVRIT